MDDYEWKKTLYTVGFLFIAIVGFVVTLIKLG